MRQKTWKFLWTFLKNLLAFSRTSFKLLLILATTGMYLLLPTWACGETWTLTQIQAKALELSPVIQIQSKLLQAERHDAMGAGRLPNPTALIIPGYTSQENTTGSLWDLTLTQVLPFPGKRSSIQQIQEYQARLAEASEAEARLLIEHGVTLAAVRVGMLDAVSHHSEERRHRFRLIQKYLRTHPQVSPSQKIETALIENQIRLLEKGMHELAGELLSARFLLGFYLQTTHQIDPQIFWINSAVLPDKNALLKHLQSRNPGLIRKEIEMQQAHLQLIRAKLDPWPDLYLGFNYRTENVIIPNRFYQINFGFTLPLYNHGQYTIPAARARLEAEESRKHLLSLELERDFNTAWARVVTSSNVLAQFPLKLVQESEKSFSRAEAEFKKARINASTFLQTDFQIHETLDSIYESQVVFLEQLSRLLLLVGEPLKWEELRR